MGRPGRAQQTAGFEQRKHTFLSKIDKSSAGGIDAHAVEVCDVINDRDDAFTTSSCSGRAFLWRGEGVKSTSKFVRYRVTHELVDDAELYFDLETLSSEIIDGAWEENRRRTREKGPTMARSATGASMSLAKAMAAACSCICGGSASRSGGPRPASAAAPAGGDADASVWLRFEPFILHVNCRDLGAAQRLIVAARSVFKNVGLQSWGEGRSMLAIWGDEGLEMALSDPHGRPLFPGQHAWLQELVNSRHRRNWAKIDRFTAALRADAANGGEVVGCQLYANGFGEDVVEEGDGDGDVDASTNGNDSLLEPMAARSNAQGRVGPRSFDVIGDIAVLTSMSAEVDAAERAAVGARVLAENRKIRVVAARCGSLQTDHRKPGALDIIAGAERRPLITTHQEFGVRIMVDLEAVFFNPRMGPERQRICRLVEPQERVCVLFAGCGPEVLQLLDKTEAAMVAAVEVNPDAVRCARRGLETLARKQADCQQRALIIEGDMRTAVSQLEAGSFHRILAPRPKGKTEEEDDALVEEFLEVLIPLLRPEGVCHWYDFVADWEFPACERSAGRIRSACSRAGRGCSILRSAAANNKPVAERQYRTVIDFSVR